MFLTTCVSFFMISFANWQFGQGDTKGPAKAGDGSGKKDALGVQAGSSNQVDNVGLCLNFKFVFIILNVKLPYTCISC